MQMNRLAPALLLLGMLAGCAVSGPDAGFSGISADTNPGKSIPFEIREAADVVSVEMAEDVTIDLSGTLYVQPPTTDNGITTQITSVSGENMDFHLVSMTYAQLTKENLDAALESVLAGFPEPETTRRSFSIRSRSGAEVSGTEWVYTSNQRTSINRLFRVGETNTLLLLTAVCEASEQLDEARMALDRVQVP